MGDCHRALLGPAHLDGLVLKSLQEHVGKRALRAFEGLTQRAKFGFKNNAV